MVPPYNNLLKIRKAILFIIPGPVLCIFFLYGEDVLISIIMFPGLRRPLGTITPLSTNSRIPFILVPNPNGEERIPDSESNRQPYQGKRSPKTPLVLPDVPETMS